MSLYLDNAATSFPKPDGVCAAVDHMMRTCATNPGRGGYRLSLEAGRTVLAAREAVAHLVNLDDPAQVIFTGNATEAINIGLFGLLSPGDRVVTTSMEHNAVVRPLRALADRGVEVVRVAADPSGCVAPAEIMRACTPKTRLVVMTHCSNVTGTVQPIDEIGPWCRGHGILFMVDAAQSAGLFPIDMRAMAIDLLAAPGHKALYGPPGTGFLCVGEGMQLKPLMYGGTGTRSMSDAQPDELPERLESGTLNVTGLAGLRAALDFVNEIGIETLRRHEQELVAQLHDGLLPLPGCTVYGLPGSQRQGGVLSFTLAGFDTATVGYRLDTEFDICVRVGLHCAPDAHRTIGSFPEGTIRVSPGWFNTAGDIDRLLAALRVIATA